MGDYGNMTMGDAGIDIRQYLGILTWREFLNFPCILHSMPHPTPRNHIRLKHSVGTRLQRAFRKTMLPPCTGRGAEVLLPDRGLLVLGDANLPRPCTVAGPGSPFPPPHNPLTDPPPPTLHHQFVPRLIPHFFQPHAPLAPPTPFSTTPGHALGPRTSAAHGGPAPRTEFCSSREASFAVARTATPPLLSYGPERDRGRDELSREKGGLP